MLSDDVCLHWHFLGFPRFLFWVPIMEQLPVLRLLDSVALILMYQETNSPVTANLAK